MFGCSDWQKAYAACKAGDLTPTALREELVNLMRWRLETELGYAVTPSFEMKNLGGVPLYTMIFATDNATGNKVMSWIYDKAAKAQPQMKVEALAKRQAGRDERTGVLGLFEPPVPWTSPFWTSPMTGQSPGRAGCTCE